MPGARARPPIDPEAGRGAGGQVGAVSSGLRLEGAGCRLASWMRGPRCLRELRGCLGTSCLRALCPVAAHPPCGSRTPSSVLTAAATAGARAGAGGRGWPAAQASCSGLPIAPGKLLLIL